MAQITMPKYKKYYISGIEFDTRTYCADFTAVIESQAKKIKALEAEVAQLQRQQQKALSIQRKKEHEAALKTDTHNINIVKTKSKIIISDKPIE
jgi:NCAIR mutase (PurE)-related protein